MITAITVAAAMVAVLVAVGGLLTALYRRGANEGRLTEILSNLEKITADHEMRLRMLEQHREH